MREEFEGQHTAMIDTANSILAMVESCSNNRSNELNRLRLTLSRMVTAHCKEEAAILEASANVPADVVRRYHDELLQWRFDLIACNTDWPPDRVWSDPSGFKTAYQPIVKALEARIAWERGAVYPVLPKKAA